MQTILCRCKRCLTPPAVFFVFVLACSFAPAAARENLLANPGFESVSGDFFTAWNHARTAGSGTVLFVDETGGNGRCLRMIGTPGTWTTCPAKPITVEPETEYWITWSFKARQHGALAEARKALLAPVLLDPSSATTSPARTEAVRLLAGNQLEIARTRPVVIAYPTRVAGQLAAAGWTEPGAQLTVNGKPVAVQTDGRFTVTLADGELAAGLLWTAETAVGRKQWRWPPLQ